MRGRVRGRPAEHGLLTLQRQAGNAAVARLLAVQRQPLHPELRRGSHGEAVNEAQRKLSRVQASADPLTEDGTFGPLTVAAVRTFQTTAGIAPANGVLNAATWTRLDTTFGAQPAPVRAVLSLGANNADVGLAQQKLNALGGTPRLPVDAVFSQQMLLRVILFEAFVMHRFPTGTIDAPMWKELDAAAPGGGTVLEGASTTPVEQHVASGTANSLGQQVAGTSLHGIVGVGGITRGKAVKELQQKLNTAGAAPPLKVDGAFGPKTTAALQQFQSSRVPAIPATGIADPATWAVLDAVAPASTIGFVERQWTEELGGATFGKTGANASRYSWEIKPDRMLVTARVNFTGLPPPATWFGYVAPVWNIYQAVRPAPPQKLPIDFELVRGTGADAMTIVVHPGNQRANAGNWYVGDPDAKGTVPHEYGHLIGLQDEYQQHAGDYVRATGHEPPVGQVTGPVGVTPAQIALQLQNAMVAHNDLAAFNATSGAGVTMGAFGQQIVAAYATLPAVNAPFLAAVAGPPAFPAIPAYTTTGNLVVDLDRTLHDTTNRYETIQSLTYSSGSLMGDPARVSDPHDHGTQPRHVAQFVEILGRAIGGAWKAERR